MSEIDIACKGRVAYGAKVLGKNDVSQALVLKDVFC